MGRGREKNSLSSRLPGSLVGRADVRKSILKLIEAYRVITDEMTKSPPLEFDALYTPIFLAHSNRLCDPVKMVERFSSLFDERRISTTVSIVRMNVFVYHNFLHERPYSVIDIHDSE